MSSPERPQFNPFEIEPRERQPSSRGAIINEMQHIAPPGQTELDDQTIERLRDLTGTLVELEGSTVEAEYDRFLGVRQRGLELQTDSLYKQLSGKTIVVTGGTGCIGSALLGELTQFDPTHVVSISRGIMKPRHGVAGVEYAHVDIRDKDKLGDTFRRVRPDIVYHLAAQHDPSLAETAVTHTLTTNITGTNNVIEAARASDTSQIVYASTGKALRPFTPDTYASSKKASEWLMADAVKRGEMFCSGVRFTHVVDNSIIHRRIQDWIANDQPIRLHGSDILFYMQSAKESAHLLLNVGLEAEEGTFNLQTIRDLDWPVNLMDLALGAVARAGTNTPVYICGFESGYEERAYPGLYDPMLSGEMSPLINAFEAPQANHSATCPQVDNFPFEMTTDARLVERLRALERVCAEGAPNEVLHEAKDNLSWTMLDTRLRSVSKTVLERIARRMANVSYREQLTDEHRRINSTVNAALRQG